MELSQEEKVEVLLEVGALLVTLFSLLDDSSDNSEAAAAYHRMTRRCQAICEELENSTLPVGRGFTADGQPAAPRLELPRSRMYEVYVELPDMFCEIVGFYPSEFEDLHNDVVDVLSMVRDVCAA